MTFKRDFMQFIKDGSIDSLIAYRDHLLETWAEASVIQQNVNVERLGYLTIAISERS